MARIPFNEEELIFDWNSFESETTFPKQPQFLCETLRDGIQSPSVFDPHIDDKLRLVWLANELGIQYMDVGLPGAGPRAVADVTAIVQFIRDEKLAIRPACAARTHQQDIQPIIDISQKVGMAIEVMAFIASSPIRQYAENWDVDWVRTRSEKAIDFAVEHQLPVTYVTEDTTRSRPAVLETLFRSAVDHGATRLCLCDTVGHATTEGIRSLVTFTRDLLSSMGRSDVGIDWHGHNDRGLAVVNTISALQHGVDRVHGTALGVGERVGNAALDQVLVNLKLRGLLANHDLSRLLEWCNVTSDATLVPIPAQYPLAGADAFRTATGIHAAAIIKAQKKGNAWLADRIYSGVPAGMFGRDQEIEIGHYSGTANVTYWLQKRGYEPTPALIDQILQVAKAGNRTLSEQEIIRIIRGAQKKAG